MHLCFSSGSNSICIVNINAAEVVQLGRNIAEIKLKVPPSFPIYRIRAEKKGLGS